MYIVIKIMWLVGKICSIIIRFHFLFSLLTNGGLKLHEDWTFLKVLHVTELEGSVLTPVICNKRQIIMTSKIFSSIRIKKANSLGYRKFFFYEQVEKFKWQQWCKTMDRKGEENKLKKWNLLHSKTCVAYTY